ncbi:DUF7563 family protein [Natronorubrum sulfidifaciens]|uniref:Small CPxCG-related zinc finger protein n=1 Tax=Natronorubrum sulfidifaciens JCM 14089 TaxID=1230460 RepID=L9WFE4_9EURY|nr:hypothetical protein [Natronorubrum sulfidifaciens]ELY48077.1 hypothetical protein C495_01345 [Natronorubrum sulfidifaciens JCM 14089]
MVGVTISLQSSTADSSCRHCGAHVSDRFSRVFGDDDRVHRCSECDTYARLSRGSAAGVDVRIPDPETSPGRHGGEANA